MRRSWMIAAAIAIVATAWVLSGQLPGSDSAEAEVQESSAAVPAEEVLAKVRVDRVSAEPMINTLTLQGRTLADRKVEIRAEATGLIEAVLAKRGAQVASGTALVRIDVDDRMARLDEANALLAQRQIEFDAARQLNERGYRADTQLAQSQAALDAARATVEIAELAVSNLTIRAPFDGVVEHRYVEIGDYVDYGDPVAMLVDLDPLRIVGQISERYLGQIAPGRVGSAHLVDGRVVDGAVSYVGSVADEVTRTFTVEIEIDNAGGQMIEGLTAELTLPIRQVLAHRVSPAVLSLSNEGEIGVKAVDENGIVLFYPVEILGGTEDLIWVGGLPETLDMIVVGQEFVLNGQLVQPVSVDDIVVGGGAA